MINLIQSDPELLQCFRKAATAIHELSDALVAKRRGEGNDSATIDPAMELLLQSAIAGIECVSKTVESHAVALDLEPPPGDAIDEQIVITAPDDITTEADSHVDQESEGWHSGSKSYVDFPPRKACNID